MGHIIIVWGITFGLATMAALFRGRLFAMFMLVLFSIQSLVLTGLFGQLSGVPRHALTVGHGLAAVHFLTLVWAGQYHGPGTARERRRPWLLRFLITWPGHVAAAGTFLAIPWAVVAGLGFFPFLWWLPYALGVVGLFQSLRTPALQQPHIAVPSGPPEVHPKWRRLNPDARTETPGIRVGQITDPHLGPTMSVRRLQRICEALVAAKPDLIALTGDFLTMESHESPRPLAQALSPLKAYAPRVLAVLGNHDYEALELVKSALAQNDIPLLRDETVRMETQDGRPFEVLGLDYRWTDRADALAAACAAHPRDRDVPRIALLHVPNHAEHLAPHSADIVLSGHTHGGQLGFQSLGLMWTALSPFGIPDHGLWQKGEHPPVYVHRGNGVYGFPVRLGVGAEHSIIEWLL